MAGNPEAFLFWGGPLNERLYCIESNQPYVYAMVPSPILSYMLDDPDLRVDEITRTVRYIKHSEVAVWRQWGVQRAFFYTFYVTADFPLERIRGAAATIMWMCHVLQPEWYCPINSEDLGYAIRKYGMEWYR